MQFVGYNRYVGTGCRRVAVRRITFITRISHFGFTRLPRYFFRVPDRSAAVPCGRAVAGRMGRLAEGANFSGLAKTFREELSKCPPGWAGKWKNDEKRPRVKRAPAGRVVSTRRTYGKNNKSPDGSERGEHTSSSRPLLRPSSDGRRLANLFGYLSSPPLIPRSHPHPFVKRDSTPLMEMEMEMEMGGGWIKKRFPKWNLLPSTPPTP